MGRRVKRGRLGASAGGGRAVRRSGYPVASLTERHGGGGRGVGCGGVGGGLDASAARGAPKRGTLSRSSEVFPRGCECADAHRMFVRRTLKLARQQGKTPVVWDEVFDLFGGAPSVGDTNGLDPSTVIQQWRWSWHHLDRTRAITGAGLRLLWMVLRRPPPTCPGTLHKPPTRPSRLAAGLRVRA